MRFDSYSTSVTAQRSPLAIDYRIENISNVGSYEIFRFSIKLYTAHERAGGRMISRGRLGN